MSKKKTSDALSRSDAVRIAALAIILATASAAVGSAMTYRPSTAMTSTQITHRAAAPQKPAPVQVIAASTGPDSISADLLAEHRCLAEVLYYEARGEGRQGQQAIAEVVFHRMNTGNYGHSICAVVYEGAGHPGCQFTFTCNGDLTKAKEEAAWRESEALAAEILTGEAPLHNATAGATNFHAVTVTPEWADTMKQTTQIGNHLFYRGQALGHDSDS
jgi:spore germination cell wall hydrolase CwlJ-like protein